MTDHLNRKPNIFRHATSELSQDAFLLWLVGWVNYPDDPAMQRMAKSFVSYLYNRKYGADASSYRDILSIEIIEKQHHKIDVFFRARIGDKRVSFIIEDKVHTSHHSGQLQRYLNAVKTGSSAEDRLVAIYYKTGYIFDRDKQAEEKDPATGERYYLVGHEDMHAFMAAHPVDNPYCQDYFDYLGEKFYHHYPRVLTELMDGHETEHFKYDFAQYDFMKRLAGACPEHLNVRKVYRGVNPNGTAYAQYKFAEFRGVYEPGVSEALFYRLDRRKNSAAGETAYYLCIRQHAFIKGSSAKVADPALAARTKLERLNRFRKLFELSARTDLPIRFGGVRQDRSGRNESEVAILFFDSSVNTPQAVLAALPMLHQAFVESIKRCPDLLGF